MNTTTFLASNSYKDGFSFLIILLQEEYRNYFKIIVIEYLKVI